jgi:hypothetical protein
MASGQRVTFYEFGVKWPDYDNKHHKVYHVPQRRRDGKDGLRP